MSEDLILVMCSKRIRREDLENVKDLGRVMNLFQTLGFCNVIQPNAQELRISINTDSMERILVIIVENKGEMARHFSKIDGIEIVYLTLITQDFNLFTFVKKEFSTTGKVVYRKFSFNRLNPSHTTLEKINNLSFNSPDTFNALFDTYEVVKEFYEEFIKIRFHLVQTISGLTNEIEKIHYAQIILNRLIFLYFIQKKGLLDKDPLFLQSKYSIICKTQQNFFRNFLLPLFFEVLSKKHEITLEGFGRVPYLNGGLFRKHELELNNININIPNEIFQEIFTFFEQYHWYSDERSDYGEEKGISPEILGHIFEKTINALSNSGTGQKDAGAFYTPEIITKHLAEQTIFPHILEKLNERLGQSLKLKFDRISQVFGERPEDQPNKKVLVTLLEELRDLTILDNACGSGAFLLAVLNTLDEIWARTLFPILSMEEIKPFIFPFLEAQKLDYSWFRWKFETLESFDADARWKYWIRRSIITNTLYGIDIEDEAVEITKLRLWLALFTETYEQIENVEPLPNIDYNFRVGNTLVGFSELVNVTGIDSYIPITGISASISSLMKYFPKEMKIITDLVNKPELKNLIKIKQLLIRLFKNVEAPELQTDLKTVIDELMRFLSSEFDKRYVTFVNSTLPKKGQMNLKRIQQLKPFHWIFEFPEVLMPEKQNNEGFCMIIGNPPYGDILQGDEKVLWKGAKYGFVKDSSSLFIERSLSLIRDGGRLSYVLPKTIGFYSAWAKVRELLLSQKIENILDLGLGFEEVNAEQLTITVKKNHDSIIKNSCDVKISDQVSISTAEPLKKRTAVKHIELNGSVPQALMCVNNTLIFRPIMDIEQTIIEYLQQSTVKLREIYQTPVFRSYYISDKVKKTMNQGDTFWIDKVPHVKRYYLDQVQMIDINDVIQLSLDGKIQKDAKKSRESQDKILNKIQKIMRPRLFFKVLRGNRLTAFIDPVGKFLTTEKLVNVIIPEDSEFDIFALLAIVNSFVPSYYIEKMIFSETTETSRVMDDVYLGEIPIPRILFNQKMLKILVQYLIVLNLSIESREKYQDLSDYIEKQLVDLLVFEAYFSDIWKNDINSTLFPLLDKYLIPIDFDTIWQSYLTQLKNNISELPQTTVKLYKNSISIIFGSVKNIKVNPDITKVVNNIQNYPLVKTIKNLFTKGKIIESESDNQTTENCEE